MTIAMEKVIDWTFYAILGMMSLSGIAMVVWRLLLNRSGNTIMNEFLPTFQKKLDQDGVEGGLRYCRSRSDIIPRRLYVAGLENAKQGTAAMRRAMANAVELEIVPDLNFLLAPILAIAKIATMVGLLGTVVSMIFTFQKIKPGADTSAHSSSIGLALFATALGLVTAIPLVFSHVLFKAWVAKFEVKMKSAAQKLLILVQARQSSSGSKSGPAPTGRAGIDPSAISPRR
jgi:biopolymer transport protein ExbB